MIRSFVVLLLLLIWFSVLFLGNESVFLGLLTLVCMGVALEIAIMLPGAHPPEKLLLAMIGITCAVLLIYGLVFTEMIVALATTALMVAAPFLVGKPEEIFNRGITFVGWGALLIVALVCLGGLARLRLRPDGTQVVAFVSACTLFRDLAANLGGRLATGGRPIAAHVNTTKTWKGAIFGAGATMLLALIGIRMAIFESIGLLRAVLIATVCGVGGQCGDLFESFLKRRAGLRDSSRVFTAHQGGVLDAIDGFLCSVPLVELVLKLAAV